MASPTPIPLRGDSREARNEGESGPRIFLQPVAPPSILGLYGFAGATFMVAAHMAKWYGGAATDLYLAPFCALFGGVAQFSAGMWSFRARDGVASAMHGMWGAFWIAFGLLQLGFMSHALTKPAGAFPALGYWFIVLGAITWVGAAAAATENKALMLVLLFLAGGSTAAAISDLTGVGWVNITAGYLFLLSAFVAFYTASALMLENASNRSVLKVGKTQRVREEPAVMPGRGEPGVIRGQ